MLRQIKVKETENYPQRLWFTDRSHDLFVWINFDRQPLAFQFCYNKLQNEHAILWNLQHGYSHQRVDSGEAKDKRYKMSPIMIEDGDIEILKIAADFKRINQRLDPELADFIYQKLLEFHN